MRSLQKLLKGVLGDNQIDSGNSNLEALSWLIQQYIPVLVKICSLQKQPDARRIPPKK
ncbi:hypothetical protein H6G36_09370 [Anabaena minutissima FACHB-250]|nr:hypothetical protein [Anabaena minutissima FACHB-250]